MGNYQQGNHNFLYPVLSQYQHTECSADGGAQSYASGMQVLYQIQHLDFSAGTLHCLLPRKRFVLIGMNNNNNTSSPQTSLRLEPVIDVTLLPFNSLMIRPPSSLSAWQTATPGWIPGPPPAARPFLFVSPSAERILYSSAAGKEPEESNDDFLKLEFIQFCW